MHRWNFFFVHTGILMPMIGCMIIDFMWLSEIRSRGYITFPNSKDRDPAASVTHAEVIEAYGAALANAQDHAFGVGSTALLFTGLLGGGVLSLLGRVNRAISECQERFQKLEGELNRIRMERTGEEGPRPATASPDPGAIQLPPGRVPG